MSAGEVLRSFRDRRMNRLNRSMSWVLVCSCAHFAGACGQSSQRIESRVGEVHVHQESRGAELSARFIAPPTAIELTRTGSALPPQNIAIFNSDGCEVFNVDGCVDCVPPMAIDGGRVKVTSEGRSVAMTWDAGYDELLVAGTFLRAGAPVAIESEGAPGVKPFSHELMAPPALLAEDTLGLGIDADFEVVWQPSGEDLEVTVLINVVPMRGDNIAVLCTAQDAAGQIRLPAGAFALLPPRPRQVQLQTSRVRNADIPLGNGTAVTAHAGFTTFMARDED